MLMQVSHVESFKLSKTQSFKPEPEDPSPEPEDPSDGQD